MARFLEEFLTLSVKNLATFKENQRCGKVDVKKYIKNLAILKENSRCGKEVQDYSNKTLPLFKKTQDVAR